jgi:hypothetical protein
LNPRPPAPKAGALNQTALRPDGETLLIFFKTIVKENFTVVTLKFLKEKFWVVFVQHLLKKLMLDENE